MLDVFSIPNNLDNVKVYYPTVGGASWQTWQKPRACNFIYIMCIGAGSGGQGGGAGSNSAGRGGGSGAITTALFPAQVLPDTLYVQAGTGSAGGAGSTLTGSATLSATSSRSAVSIVPGTSIAGVGAMNLVCVSGTAAAAGSIGETAATVTAAGLMSLGNFRSVAGIAGGGNTASYTPFTASGLILSPGAGGNRTINSVNLGITVTPSIIGNGVWNWKPMYGLGGAGGFNGDIGGVPGTPGFSGSFGCGGGGGGFGFTVNSDSGGAGGRGGGGLVMIVTF